MGRKSHPFGETLPRKNNKDFNFSDKKLNKLTKSRLEKFKRPF